MLSDDKLHLAGFFSAHLRKHQVTWLPCDVKALAITTVVTHFMPYILQANQRTHVLTDSRPCVLEYQKLCRGEFSNSAHVTTFLSTVSRFRLTIDHLARAANLPSDFASPNPLSCPYGQCQVCLFAADLQEASVRSMTVQGVVEGSISMPFNSHPAWISTKQECLDLRRVPVHLEKGIRPQKKVTNIPDVKR